jgi:hypothetical protein
MKTKRELNQIKRLETMLKINTENPVIVKALKRELRIAKQSKQMKTQTAPAFLIAAILLGSYLTYGIVNALINLV